MWKELPLLILYYQTITWSIKQTEFFQLYDWQSTIECLAVMDIKLELMKNLNF